MEQQETQQETKQETQQEKHPQKQDQLELLEKEVSEMFKTIQHSVEHSKVKTYEELIVSKAVEFIQFMKSQFEKGDFYISESDLLVFRFNKYSNYEDFEDISEQVFTSVKRILTIPTKYSFVYNDKKYIFNNYELTGKNSFKIVFCKSD